MFSKMDLKAGYHQLSINEETRKIATFSTPWGNYRPKRLIFGAKSSQDVFDQAMFQIFGDIPLCMNQRDDIILGGKDREEHNKTLRRVLQRAKDYGIKFNREKSEFCKTQITFFGHLFTSEGLKPDPRKIEAVLNCKEPKSKEEVRSFLGMTGYLDNFITNYATLSAPLTNLTRNKTKFKWNNEEKEAFEKLKSAITSSETMAYFDPNKQTTLRTEASFHEGLSAALFQKGPLGQQPIHFISRRLSDTEKRYSQTEKDALAVKWAVTRLRNYLIGAPKFLIITAHKPLIPMFNKAEHRLPPRIEKWIMEITDFDFELKYEPGRNELDPLDYISRHPISENYRDNTEQIINHISHKENAETLERIRTETKKDDTLTKLTSLVTNNDWIKAEKDIEILPYKHIKEEISIIEGIVYRGDKIIIPKSLQRKIAKIGHYLGHLGRTKTKQLLRGRYWFPKMNSMIDRVIDQCYECKVVASDPRPEPIKPTSIPKRSWEVVNLDFGGPYPDGHYNLVMVDQRSRYPVVEEVQNTSFKQTRIKLKEIFATYGTPRKILTDNGPPFQSKEFSEFAEEEGFYHHRITPLHPQANGEVESFMRMVNKAEQIANLQNKDKIERRINIIEMLTAYRATPHPATGIEPYKAMEGRDIRIKLDYNKPNKTETEKKETNEIIEHNDEKYKNKFNANRRTKERKLIPGDYVLVKQPKRNKWSTQYEPTFYIVTETKGSQIRARRIYDEREITRDISHFKLANQLVNERLGTDTDNSTDRMEIQETKNNVDNYSDYDEICTNYTPTPEATTIIENTPQKPDEPSTDEDENGATNEGGTKRPRRKKDTPRHLKDYIL